MSPSLAVGEQVRLIAGLRWRLFCNSLRTLRGRLDLVSQALLWLFMGGLMFGGGITIGFAAYLFISHGEAIKLGDLFWAVFLFWQLYPILAGAGGAQFDFSHLLRFPLRYASFFTLSLSYGLFEPAAVVSLLWLLCLFLGVVVARPELYLWTLFVVVMFAAMNLALSRAIATWADRWMAQRRTREILGFVILLTILLVQFAIPALADWQPGKRAGIWLRPLGSVAHLLPPGFAAAALDGKLAASWLRAVAGLLAVCLYAAAFLWLLHVRLAAQYRGENLGEARVAPPAAGHARPDVSPAAAWQMPWQSSAMAALLEREVRYTMRNWQALFQLFFPALFFVAFGPGLKQSGIFARHAGMVFPMALSYVFLMLENWFFNSFAYEGEGIRFLFLAPVRFRQVMLGKNLFQAVAVFANVLFVWIFVRWSFGSPEPWIVPATFAAAAFALLVNLAAGNIISLCFPIRREIGFGNFRLGRTQSGMGALIGLGIDLGLIVTGAVVFIACELLGHMGAAVWIFLALAAASAIGYAIGLRAIDRVALKHRESLLEILCRAESAS